MAERERLIELIKQAKKQTKNAKCDIERNMIFADHLLANGVMLVDTDAVCLVTNREPIRTAFGMPLDELAELIRAKQDERIIVPPCKVGDTIYLPWEFNGIKSIAYLTVTHIIFDEKHKYVKTDFRTDDEAYYDKYKCGSYEFEDFGEIVFLSREEAEKALERSRG